MTVTPVWRDGGHPGSGECEQRRARTIGDVHTPPASGRRASGRVGGADDAGQRSGRAGHDGRGAITGIVRQSKPGRRVYVGNQEIPRVKSGLGVAIVSTSRGILADHNARDERVGGELLLMVW